MAQKIRVTGVVQGVGFRPFVYGLATQLDLHGWVRNTAGGVEIFVDGRKSEVENFIHRLPMEAPPLAKINSIIVKAETAKQKYTTFDIRHSKNSSNGYQPISVDVAICPDCERELFDPNDRRYLYPFINCTNCGPRFTIIKDIPYDRSKTTMANFPMCDNCNTEYQNPRDRRFHAQPVACDECGPFVELRCYGLHCGDKSTNISNIEYRTSAIVKTRRLLRKGAIVAIKGLGGFHLACDASDPVAIRELRRRKGRLDKPFAVMAANMDVLKSICEVSKQEQELLTGHIKPVVLLQQKAANRSKDFLVCYGVAPNLDTLGVMLPYTPLHHLLINQTDPILMKEPVPPVLVMTSGNFSEEPIVTGNQEALQYLSPLADAFLLHDRDIHVRCDDSVVRVDKKDVIHLRRSRGYAPYPVQLPFKIKPTIAVGGELKNTFCLGRDQYAFLSHHIGNMENAETYESFEQGIRHLSHIFRVEHQLLAHDLHPNYFTTRYANKSDIPKVGVQHHHAHIASCMADNGLTDRQLIGLSFDGTGYGTDGAIWGGEVLLASYSSFERFTHVEYLPLPGGDSAIRYPWRIAIGYAHALGIDIENLPFLKDIEHQAVNILKQQIDKGINTPLTSSMGRLFDATASLIGVRNNVTYEAQAVIEMENLSRPFTSSAKLYPYSIDKTIQVKDLLSAIIQDVRENKPIGMISARFLKTIAQITVDVCKQARTKNSLNNVALSGGVWQNQILLDLVRDGLKKEKFVVYFHKQVPANDGGLALGQAVAANFIAKKK